MNEKPYLADVQVGDKLYNFCEHNKEYIVEQVVHDGELIFVKSVSDEASVSIYNNGHYRRGCVPIFLYQPVDVLDPKNLPPRPWKPKKGEWIWCRDAESSWDLRMFIKEDKHGYLVASALGNTYYAEIAPFKGELPPGLEVNNESD